MRTSELPKRSLRQEEGKALNQLPDRGALAARSSPIHTLKPRKEVRVAPLAYELILLPLECWPGIGDKLNPT